MAEQDTLFGEPLFLPEIVEIDYSELRIEYNNLVTKFTNFLFSSKIGAWNVISARLGSDRYNSNFYIQRKTIKSTEGTFFKKKKVTVVTHNLIVMLNQEPTFYSNVDNRNLPQVCKDILRAIRQINEYKLQELQQVNEALKEVRG